MNNETSKEQPSQIDSDDANRDGQQFQLAKRVLRAWALWLVIAVALLAFLIFSNGLSRSHELPTWEDFRSLAKDGAIIPESVVVRNDRIECVITADYASDAIDMEPGKETPVSVMIDAENREFFLHQLDELNLRYRLHTSIDSWWPIVFGWLPLLLIFGFFMYIIWRARQAAESGPMGMFGRFTRSQHRLASKDEVNVTFDDIAGIEEAKAEVKEIIDFLQNPAKFRRVGARVPRGVLLIGPPGCGKTLLARAIAGQADVPFYSISGSDFMEMFVGVGARRVRDLFEQAKQSEPCIIFLDEIDSVGRKRGLDLITGGAHGEREQTLNAILSEMDGFEPHDQVIVIAATNRPDVLDPALIRPGRFDRQVNVPLPDIVGRREILKIHTRNVKLSDDVTLEEMARATPMFSGADLAALVNEAAIIAVMKNKDCVEMEDLRQARDKVKFGRAQTSRKIDQQQRTISAFHEAGHALLQCLLEDADPIEKVTIIPRGQALGATFSLPEKDRYGFGRKYLLATLRVLCGGRIAEQRKTEDMSSGAEDDIKKVTELANLMVREWGMSEKVGFIRYAKDSQEQLLLDKGYSEQTAAKIDLEIRQLVDEAMHDAERVIEKNWQTVEAIATALLERETLTAEEIKRLIPAELLAEHDSTATHTDNAVGERLHQ